MASDPTKTNDLKKLIQTKLKTLSSNVYFEIADDTAMYPHIVFSFRTINLDDISRQDYILDGCTCPIILALTDTLHYPSLPTKYISVSSFAEVQLEKLVPGEV